MSADPTRWSGLIGWVDEMDRAADEDRLLSDLRRFGLPVFVPSGT